MPPEAKASGRHNRAPEESKTQEPQEGSQTCDQATSTPEKVNDKQRHEKVDEPRRAVETGKLRSQLTPERVPPEAKASGRHNRAPEESKTQEPQEGSQTCDQATSTPEKVNEQTET